AMGRTNRTRLLCLNRSRLSEFELRVNPHQVKKCFPRSITADPAGKAVSSQSKAPMFRMRAGSFAANLPLAWFPPMIEASAGALKDLHAVPRWADEPSAERAKGTPFPRSRENCSPSPETSPADWPFPYPAG